MERDRSEILSIAKTTIMQLLEITPPEVFLSWGADRFRAVWSHSQPPLAFRVRWLVFTETVEIELDEGEDLYDIRLCRDGADVCTVEGVYPDQLGDVVDSLVDKPHAIRMRPTGGVWKSIMVPACSTAGRGSSKTCLTPLG